jgi:hypothetical protein
MLDETGLLLLQHTKRGGCSPHLLRRSLSSALGTLWLSTSFQSGVKVNLYNDRCAVNNEIDRKKCTILWHVDPEVVADIICKMDFEFGLHNTRKDAHEDG